MICFLLCFAKFGREDSLLVAIFYPAFGRVAWSAATCFIILATLTQKNSGEDDLTLLTLITINKNLYILESSIWSSKVSVILSRISFSCYILNPLIIMYIFMSQSSSFPLDFHMGVVTVLGFFCLSNLAAFAYTMLIEYPLVHVASYVK